MKSQIKVLLFAVFSLLMMSVTGACAAVSSDLDAQQIQQVSIIPEELMRQLSAAPEEELVYTITQLQDSGDRNNAAGLQNYLDAKEVIGEIQSVTFLDVSGTKQDGYIVRGHIDGSKRDSTVSVGLDKKLQMSSLSFAPEYTFVENMIKAGQNTLLGMGTVFAVLIFIAFIIGLLKYVNVFEKKLSEAKANKKAPERNAESAPSANTADTKKPDLTNREVAGATDGTVHPDDDKELVAVITAAVSAFTGQSGDGLIVRSIKRVSNRRR